MGDLLYLVKKPELTPEDILKNKFEALEKSLMLSGDDYIEEMLDLTVRYVEEFDSHRDLNMCHTFLILAWAHFIKYQGNIK